MREQVAALFVRARGHRVSRKRVARLMRDAGLSARRRKRARPRTTDSRHGYGIAPNLVARNFHADRPDRVWLADITYVATDEGWLYLAAIKDMGTAEIVGWAMADHLRAELCLEALERVVARRRPAPGLIHHSDRGVQGGFKRSSQHFEGGCYDDCSKATLGLGPKGAAPLARPAPGGAARALFAFLEGNSGGTLQ